MSAYTVIACDAEVAPGDRCMAEDSPPGLPAAATEARARLAREGWRRRRDPATGRLLDLCPTHATPTTTATEETDCG